MHRFFVPPESLSGSRVRVGGEAAQQIRRVLRMRPGDHFCLLDGRGSEYRVILAELGKDDVWADVLERVEVRTEPLHRVNVCLSLLNKPDKFEWALQKCTELGAARFVPIIAERSVAGALRSVRRERWSRIIQEAAEQSGRGLIPTLDEPVTLEVALVSDGPAGEGRVNIAIMPELGGTQTIAGTITDSKQVRTVSMFIGPEGGFTPTEIGLAKAAGMVMVTLGARTLRAETAAVATLTLVMNQLGEMGA